MAKEQFYIGQPGATAGTLIASSSSTRTIDQASVCNTTDASATLTLYIVPAGDAAAADVAVYSEKLVAPGETLTLPALVNQAIPRGGTVEGLASTASALTLTISGRVQ